MATAERPVRRRSIRAMLTPLFIVPLVSLVALWVFAASVTLLNALREHDFTTENQRYGGQAQLLGLQLAQERSAVFVWLSSRHHPPASVLTKQTQMTDGAIAAFEHGVHSGSNMSTLSAGPALTAFNKALGRLDTIRAKAVAGRISPLGAFEAYNAIIDAQFRVYSKLIVVDNSSLYQQATASLTAGRAIEMVDREVTLVNGALADRGHISRGERLLFATTVANQRLLIGDALRQLSPALAAGYHSVYTSPSYKKFSAMEDRIVNSIGNGGSVPVTQNDWSRTAFSLLGGFQKAELKDRAVLARNGTAVGDRLLLQVLLAGGLGLIAVLLSVFLMIRFGRRITRELTGLQRSAQELATERLPSVVEQLSRGEDVTATTATATGRIAEIAKVAEAFTAVQSTAVEAAAGQARLRRGVSQVFRNLAGRSQSLLHRQLALLDRMERSSTDAATLEELFQLDHLTTRMRRHAEGLIILSGEAPGRGWREPVPVVDVLRAAIAEVEDFTRVGVLTRNTDAVAGPAVADVIHLLAELIENATTSSPSNTEITVRAERVAHGIAVEVEDRGLGMTEEDMAAANERFASPPEFDLADSDKLGFFVVARLAARHDIKITLRMSPYGGVAAVVLLPHTITVTPDTTDTDMISAYPDPLGLPPAGWQPGAVAPPARLAAAPVAEDTLGLPRRVRYDDHEAAAAAADQAPPPGTPEAIGALVASLQHGWLDGRNQAAEQDDS
ncbi:MAG TPA: nitrate- and nitrite sensing domain-containing protein [Streptosporangiaceae bacterium]|nr:nitrate- and nitrite sensing domain-containing protein [Streptosporangiaceae bacterium]